MPQKSLLEQIMFFAAGAGEKSNFVTTIYRPSRCVIFFKSLKPRTLYTRNPFTEFKDTICAFIIKPKLFYTGIK